MTLYSSFYSILRTLLLGACLTSGPEENTGELVSQSPLDEAASPTEHEGEPTVVVVRQGAEVALDPSTRRALVAHAERGLAVCNFTSLSKPEYFHRGDLDGLWAERKSGAYVFIGYGQPKRMTAVAGELVLDEVLLALDTPAGPEPALAKSGGSTLGLKKCGWDDRSIGCVAELEALFGRPEYCPPVGLGHGR